MTHTLKYQNSQAYNRPNWFFKNHAPKIRKNVTTNMMNPAKQPDDVRSCWYLLVPVISTIDEFCWNNGTSSASSSYSSILNAFPMSNVGGSWYAFFIKCLYPPRVIATTFLKRKYSNFVIIQCQNCENFNQNNLPVLFDSSIENKMKILSYVQFSSIATTELWQKPIIFLASSLLSYQLMYEYKV